MVMGLCLAWVVLCWLFIMYRVAKGTTKVVKAVATAPQPIPFFGAYLLFLVVVFGGVILMFAKH